MCGIVRSGLVDNNKYGQKGKRNFWNSVLAKGIKNVVERTSDKRKDVSEDKCKKWVGRLIRNNTRITTIIERKIEGNPGRERS